MNVRCNCRDGHRVHEYEADGINGLCRICCHGIGAHRSDSNSEVADRLVRILNSYDLADWSIHVGDGGSLLVKMHLTTPTPVMGRS